MGHDTQFYAPGRFSWGWRRWQAGLTLVEVIVAAGMISVTCSSVMFAFTSLNQMAMVSRLYTGAAINAQSQIDLISTDSPFEPQYNIVPSELQPGTTSTSVTVYRDPISNFTVTGTMTTTVTAANGTSTKPRSLSLTAIGIAITASPCRRSVPPTYEPSPYQ